MAHGFNNLLGGILGQASLLRAQLSVSDPRRDVVTKIEAAAQRGADLNRKLLAFARKSVLQPMPLSLSALVQETAELLAGSMPRSISIQTDIDPASPLVMGDATQLQQVVMNLCVNARDAMPRGGQLSLRVAREGEEQVRLEVEDTGTGMSDEVKSHLFEPFYTNKEPGKGTGLGLAVVFGSVRSHGGTVTVESEEGKGTCFSIRFPATKASAPGTKWLETKTPERAAIEGHEKVLVIDDENIMRATCAELLSGLGYRVESAPSGDEALEKVDAGRFMPDVVVLDLVMPGLSGVPLLRELQKRMPTVPVVLISAFYKDAGVRDMLNAGARELVAKPFRIEDLAGAVRRALDDQPTDRA
jgi:CheY-like chemotaxis protein/anti-sigma regulatory factor (Ser/Thr protein kinase)